MHRLLIGCAILFGLGIQPTDARAAADSDPTSTLFEKGLIPTLRITIEAGPLNKLRGDPRNYVEASLEEEGKPKVGPIGLKLKGAAGSFRGWDDRPALTLNMDKYRKKTNFHGLTKFHLNNSIQDESCLNEAIMADLFHQAGLPAARVTHARVFLNGRDVGLYVLKEGFDRAFLSRSFADPAGNLYDGGFCQDINADLEKDEGTGVDDRSDLKALVAATQAADPAQRRERVEALLDVDAFCGFMALERIGVHWDGYTGKANNYRIYFDPRSGKATFLPHGMDQVFQEPNGNLFQPTGPLVSDAILRDDLFRRRYRAQVARLIPLIDPPTALQGKVDEIERRLEPVLAATNPDWARRQHQRAEDLKKRLSDRSEALQRQLDEADEELEFDAGGVARLPKGWASRSEQGQASFGRGEGDPPALRISAPGNDSCVASWRRRTLLPPGRYQLQVEARTEGVERLAGTDNVGVGVGRSGTPRTQHRLGTGPFEPLSGLIIVGEGQSSVELVLELRAAKGTVWFALPSLKLVREAAN